MAAEGTADAELDAAELDRSAVLHVLNSDVVSGREAAAAGAAGAGASTTGVASQAYAGVTCPGRPWCRRAVL